LEGRERGPSLSFSTLITSSVLTDSGQAEKKEKEGGGSQGKRMAGRVLTHHSAKSFDFPAYCLSSVPKPGQGGRPGKGEGKGEGERKSLKETPPPKNTVQHGPHRRDRRKGRGG